MVVQHAREGRNEDQQDRYRQQGGRAALNREFETFVFRSGEGCRQPSAHAFLGLALLADFELTVRVSKSTHREVWPLSLPRSASVTVKP